MEVSILTGVNDGQAFSVRTDKCICSVNIDPPVLENGTGVLSITGTPTINAISAGQRQSYTITVTTVNGNDEVDIENPTIKVNSTSTISITSSTLLKCMFKSDIDPILFTIGGELLAIDDGGLPLGVGLNPRRK